MDRTDIQDKVDWDAQDAGPEPTDDELHDLGLDDGPMKEQEEVV